MGEDKPRQWTLYWCPRCQCQSERPFHFCEKGPALIPQLDTETCCDSLEAIELTPAVKAALREKGLMGDG